MPARKRKSPTTERGYGAAHRKRRAELAPTVAAGHTTCAKCGKPIRPGEPWDLGHTADRRGWTGPEHARCNRADGATRGNRLRGTRRPAPRFDNSRQW